MHKLYALADLNGKLVLAKSTVEEYGITPNDGRRFYNLRGIKIESTDGDPNANASYATMPDVDSIYSVAQLYGFVKKFDKDFSVGKAVNPTMLNEDGTPKIVYHGTSEKFTVFDMDKTRSSMDIQGAFFSPWEIDAAGYGEGAFRRVFENGKHFAGDG